MFSLQEFLSFIASNMTIVMNACDFVLGAIGIPANFLLIIAIIFAKDTHLKAYSLILFNSALTDLIEVIVELLAMTRMMAEFPYLVYIFEGFCTRISTSVCRISMQLELHLMFHSIIIIAVSFWYRNTVLTGHYPSFINTLLILLAILVPTLFSIFIFTWSDDSLTILPHFYPAINLTEVVHAGLNFYDNRNKFVALFCFTAPTAAYGFIFYYRHQVNRKMWEQTKTMSSRTKKMHASLLRALSYHALLPSLSMLGIVGFVAQNLGVQNAVIERIIFMSCSIPPAINPCLTLYFVGPYRRFYTQLVVRNNPERETVHSSVGPSNRTVSTLSRVRHEIEF